MEISGDPLAFSTPEEWRTWLETHHATADEAWALISKKHAPAPSVSLVEATEEALCFGWIDSAMRPIDAERFSLRYTPRRQASNWSPTNRARAERLIEEGRMTEAGFAAIEDAKRHGRWGAAATRPADEGAHPGRFVTRFVGKRRRRDVLLRAPGLVPPRPLGDRLGRRGDHAQRARDPGPVGPDGPGVTAAAERCLRPRRDRTCRATVLFAVNVLVLLSIVWVMVFKPTL